MNHGTEQSCSSTRGRILTILPCRQLPVLTFVMHYSYIEDNDVPMGWDPRESLIFNRDTCEKGWCYEYCGFNLD